MANMGKKKTTTKKKTSSKKTTTTKKGMPAKKTTKPSKASKPVPPASTVQLKVGQKAPAFSLPNQDGKIVSLSDFKGKKVVLYFYPKDDTPGCTKESCAFRDGIEEIHGSGAEVLGVSGDSVESHKKFAKKFNLNFSLISDESKKMLRDYGVWKEKSLYGRKYMGIERTTFIIDENGKIDDIFHKVKVDGHLEEVLGELDIMP
ncbi:thioredoxin-dependent thiol peroxidase [Candidatus Nitronereus thalassa]|uniref:thioredoxin-dependent peroxiredoxin n=1 Tax=Candidatus Nitronereus thalassa TaxID=3020898 RepID=A0ABU3K8J5_9BACT|nr:thioredoxin-dependent thiol peroxidase [Candidatus Nitronereus thalassa]MDT7042658.1 thioredoxin-dependent thiol peroxidase [Candidatus Nitronereus thalassa]